MRKILFLNPVGYIGGAEKSLIDLVAGLDRDQFQTLVVTLGPGPLAEELNQRGIETREILLPPTLLNLSRGAGKNRLMTIAGLPFLIWPVLIRLIRLIRTESVDLIHTNGLKAHLLGCILAPLTGRKLIWHFRNYPAAGGYLRVFRYLAKIFPTGIIANSRAVKERLGNLDKTRVVYNGIDAYLFKPDNNAQTYRKELGVADRSLVIGTIGHFAPLKGYDDLIRAMAKVCKEFERTTLIIMGEAVYPAYRNYKDEIKQLVEKLGITDSVVFVKPHPALPKILSALDIFILSSWSEGFGRANLEAMAMGKPVISTRVGGIPEVVLDGETGLLVPPHDPGAIAGAIIKLAQDRKLRKEMGTAGRKRSEYFSVKRMVEGVEDCYDVMLN